MNALYYMLALQRYFDVQAEAQYIASQMWPIVTQAEALRIAEAKVPIIH